MEFVHAPVMVREVTELLQPETPKRYLDGTIGGAGHAEPILTDSTPAGQLLGLDRDDEAVAAARGRRRRFGARAIVREEKFSAGREIFTEMGWAPVDGVVLDLGVSSRQLESEERGFSFRANA